MWKHYTRCYDHGTNDTRTEFCNCVLILPLNFFGLHRKRMWTIVFDLTPDYITLPHWAYAETLNFITLPHWTYVEILNFIIKIPKERPRYHFIFDIYNFTTPVNFFYNFGSNITFAKQGLCQFHFYYNPILEFIWQNIVTQEHYVTYDHLYEIYLLFDVLSFYSFHMSIRPFKWKLLKAYRALRIHAMLMTTYCSQISRWCSYDIGNYRCHKFAILLFGSVAAIAIWSKDNQLTEIY